jgi:GH15 family glucan-1,4-alpha-glucosidase
VTDYGLDLAVIGNGRTAALIDPATRIVWWCFPRFDGDPVFCRLLAGEEEKGFADVVLEDCVETTSDYVRNTAIVATTMRDSHGNAVKVTDFAPRFYHFGRTHRPPQLVRIIEPIAGLPRIRIRIRPTYGYGGPSLTRAMGSNHIRYTGGEVALRVTTDAPLSYIDREAPFVLTRPLHLVFGSDTPFEGTPETTSVEFCERTRAFWTLWVRRLSIS